MAYKQPKPIMRQSNYADFYQAVQAAVDRVIKNPTTVPYQNCLNCTNWDYSKDMCGKFNLKPPTDIIVYSCPDYTDNDDIPF